MIPKIIYQTWNTQNLPKKLERLHYKMRKNNLEYKHIIYTNEQMNDYMSSNANSDVKKAYWKMNHIVAKADIWRYTILYNSGGIYLDIDSEIVGSLNSLINNEDEAIISPETNENLYIQWGLIFNQNHLILEETLNYILRDIREEKNKFDHHALTVGNYAKAIFNLSKTNKFDLNWTSPEQQDDTIYKSKNLKFRVVGNVYNDTFRFKHKYNHLLRNRPKGTEVETHWSRYKGPLY